MNARVPSLPEHGSSPDEFFGLGQLLGERLVEAAAAGFADDRYLYTMVDRRVTAQHPLGVFCLASTVEPLGHRPVEQLRFALPLATSSMYMPRSVLGDEGENADYFYLKYMARRGGPKELRVDERTYLSVLQRRYRPPVRDLATKIRTFRIVPIRERDDLTS